MLNYVRLGRVRAGKVTTISQKLGLLATALLSVSGSQACGGDSFAAGDEAGADSGAAVNDASGEPGDEAIIIY